MQSRSPMSRRVSLLLASLITIFSYSITHAQCIREDAHDNVPDYESEPEQAQEHA